jgi:hypothetical protein
MPNFPQSQISEKRAVAKTKTANAIAEVFATSCIFACPPQIWRRLYAMANELSARSIRPRLNMVADGNLANGKAVELEVLVLRGEEDGTGKTGGPGSDYFRCSMLEP